MDLFKEPAADENEESFENRVITRSSGVAESITQDFDYGSSDDDEE
jgi:hypothetical protein